MGTKKKALTFLLFAGIILFTAQSAFGGCEVAALDALIDVSGNAPGTKLSGPITVFYKFKSGNPAGEFVADMYFFLRLRKGYDLHQFAAGPTEVTVPYFEAHVFFIEDFFEDTVIPALYNCTADCPSVVLKSYDMDVDWEAPGDNGGLFYFIADIVIAVQD